MGRWTLRHTDEVLVSKIETIINSAIRRLREESDGKSKLSLSYESFVENLDEEDHFVTKMIEILLTELSDRRTRPTQEDRRCISPQTSESLHSLAVMTSTYQPVGYNRFRNRSTTNLNSGPGLLYTPADSEEDDYGMGDGHGGIEGARIDSALYDVYSGGQMGGARGHPPAPGLSAAGRPDEPGAASTPRPYEGPSIPGRQLPVPYGHFSRRWAFGDGTAASNNNNSLTSGIPFVRQMPQYRPVQRRVRIPTESFHDAASEFSEFAARRRSSFRNLHDRASVDAMRPSSRPSAAQVPRPATVHDLPRATLFDPPSPAGRDNGTRVPSPSPSTDADEAHAGSTSRPPQSHGTSSLYDTRNNETGAQALLGVVDWRNLPAPRIPLRHGEAPETILPPAESILSSVPGSDTDSLTRDLGVGVNLTSLLRSGGGVDDGFERQLRAELDAWSVADRMPVFAESDQLQQNEEHAASSSVLSQEAPPVSLPTPRSVSPAGDNVRSGATLDETAQ